MKHYYNVKSYERTPEIKELPSLIDIQLRSFEDFRNGGKLLELFDEINPIQSFNGKLSLYFPGNIPQAQEFDLKHWFEEPKYDKEDCLERDMSYAAPLYVRVALVNHDEGDEIIAQDIFLGDFPLMTEKGTFIINGTERVVVSQLIRSPGVYFDVEEERATGRQLSNAKLIPDRGAWMEFETRKTDYITIKFNRKKTIPVTVLLRALAAVDDGLPKSKSPIRTGEDEEILKLFEDVDDDATHRFIETSMKNEPAWEIKKKQTIAEAALIEFYKRMRPGDPPTLDNAREFLKGQLFDQRRYDLERVGRYKLNQRLELEGQIDAGHRAITKADIVALVRQMIIINNGQRGRDDIDHLGNRRVKTVGELIGNKLRIGMRRMERVVKERMSIREAEQLTPVALINIRPIVAAVREFFGSSQLSQFMEQTNPLTELTHKRTLSALGPGGLRRERAGFDVRDVHNSHYGRICPIETPEGPNIGLIGRLASYAQVNELGFIESPYRKVISALDLDDPRIEGRTVDDDAEHELVIKRRDVVDEAMYRQLKLHKIRKISVWRELDEDQVVEEPVSDALIGKTVAEDIEHNLVVEKDAVIDDDMLRLLRLHNIKEINTLDAVSQDVSDALIGKTVAEDVKRRFVVEKGAIIDEDKLWRLRQSGVEQVSALVNREENRVDSQPVSDALIGKTVAEDVKHNLVVEHGAVIDDDMLWELRRWGVEQVSVLNSVSQEVSDALIGKTMAENVESGISVNQGDVVDEAMLAKLKLHRIRKVNVLVARAEKQAVSQAVSDALIGKTVAEDVERRFVVEKGAIIDEDKLWRLRQSGVEQVSALVSREEHYIDSQEVSVALIGKTVAEDVKHNLVVENGAIIDDDMLWELRQHNVQQAGVLAPVSQDVSQALIGKTVAEDAESGISVNQGDVVDHKLLARLKLHNVRKMRVVVRRTEDFAAPHEVSEALIGKTVAEDAEHSLRVKQGDVVNDELLAHLNLHRIRNISALVSREENYPVSQDVSDALIGKTVSEDVKHTLVVKKDADVDDDMLALLKLHNVEMIYARVNRVENYVDSQVVSDKLKGLALAENVEHTLRVKPGDVVDDDLLAHLNLHRIRNISALVSPEENYPVSQDVSDALIGKTVAEDVEHSLSVKPGDVVDDDMLALLKLHNVQEINTLDKREENYVDSQVVSDKLKGLALAENVEHTLRVKPGDVVDDDMWWLLRQHKVRRISALVKRGVEHTKSLDVSDDLIGSKLAANHEIDEHQRIIDEKIRAARSRHGISDDLFIAISKGEEVRESEHVKAFRAEIRPLHGNLRKLNRAKEDAVVDAETVETLRMFEVKQVNIKYLKQVDVSERLLVSKELLGLRVDEEIDRTSIIVEAGKTIDARVVKKLSRVGVLTVKVGMSKTIQAQERMPVNQDLLGLRIEWMRERASVIVGAGERIDAEVLKTLQLADVDTVKVWERREVEVAESATVDDALIGMRLAEEIDKTSVILEAGKTIDARVVKKLGGAGVLTVKVCLSKTVQEEKSLPLSEAKPGMEAAEDIDSQAVIVGAGETIDSEALKKLGRAGIEAVEVLEKRLVQEEKRLPVAQELRGMEVADNIASFAVIAGKDERIDEEVLTNLQSADIDSVKVWERREVEVLESKSLNDDLLGHRVAEGIDKTSVIVSADKSVDVDVLNKLQLVGVPAVIVWGTKVVQVSESASMDDDLLGHRVAEGIDKTSVIVDAGNSIDAEVLNALQLADVDSVKVWEKRKVEVIESAAVDDDLHGLRLAKRIEKASVIVGADEAIDAEVLNTLQLADVDSVKVWETKVAQVSESASVDYDLLGQRLADGIDKTSVIVSADSNIDVDTLNALRLSDVETVEVWERRIVRVSEEDDLLGQQLAERIDEKSVIAHEGQTIDEEVLDTLQLTDIDSVKVWGTKVVQVSESASVDDDLLGKQLADGIDKSSVFVREGQTVDEEVLDTLQLADVDSVKIWNKREVEVTESASVDDDLLGQRLAERIDNTSVIVSAGKIFDDEDLKKLKPAGVQTVKIKIPKTTQVPEKLSVTLALLGRVLAEDIESEVIVLEDGDILDAKTLQKLREAKLCLKNVPVVPFASEEIEYLSADKEDAYTIAQANAPLDELDQFVNKRVSSREGQKFLSAPREKIKYMDIAPRQIVGISAALIPFLSHDAANRALMGSNMQRQAVPLLSPDISVVSTGMEDRAARYSGQVLVSDIEAEVVSVQGHQVIARKADGEDVPFKLRKYERSNQSTCIDQHPLVRKGDSIKPGDVIADSSSTHDGHLALGHDVLTCFLSWDGGNYEDALLISEDMLREDKFTSIHIEKHEIEARDTKLGAEEITYDIPNVGEEALKDLDENGIVRIGAEVGPNDILVGKITPKGEKELSPEEKLLRAIFGEQAREVKDSSLRLPHGERGKVIDVKEFTRDEPPELPDGVEQRVVQHSDLPAGVEKMVRVSVAQRRKLTVGDKMAGRHGNKGVISKIVEIADMPYVEGGLPVEIILNPLGVPSRMNIGQILELHLGWAADRLGFRAITPVFDGAKESEIQAELGRAWMLDWAWKRVTEQAWEAQERLAKIAGIALEEFDDDIHVICAYLLDRVGDSGRYDNEAIILQRDEVYARRVAVAEVLREFGYDPDEIMVYDNEGLSDEVRDERDSAALRVSLRLWIQQNSPREITLDDNLSQDELFDIANSVMFKTGQALPHYGKQTLYDGRTGEPFDHPVAVGYVHMLKLAHLVEDKAHARSTGPYSLVTQQPLGGKAQFGGQRFGEMEVWALEAYGAAHILQEMLTVKSDDVQGRVKTYESIVKGEPIEEPGIPTSFRVLVKELQSLGLAVEARTGAGSVIRFGKDDEQNRRPQPATGLLGLGSR